MSAPAAARRGEGKMAGEKASPGEEGRRHQRPYQRPAITFHEALEAFAAVCNPGKADPITCPQGPIAS